MAQDKKIVEVPADEFQELVDSLKQCREDKKMLETANKFLNEEIVKYNSKFVEKESNVSSR